MRRTCEFSLLHYIRWVFFSPQERILCFCLYFLRLLLTVLFYIATHLHYEVKSGREKNLSNKAPASSWRARCWALKESVTESGEWSFLDCGEINPPLAGSAGGWIRTCSASELHCFALMRRKRHSRWTAPESLPTLVEKSRFSPSAAFSRQQRSRVSHLPRTGDLCLLLFSDARAVSCPHVGEERFALRLGYMQNALGLAVNTTSLPSFRAAILFWCCSPWLRLCMLGGKEWRAKPSLIRLLEVRGATFVSLPGRESVTESGERSFLACGEKSSLRR